MKEKLFDLKLKRLIQLCKETRNYKKLAVVSFVLTSNTVDEIGIKLGMRPREKNSGEKIFEYMELVNKVFRVNFSVNVFRPELIDVLKRIELLFMKKEGELRLEYVKEIFEIYYELRKLDVPNLHDNINSEIIDKNRTISLFSFLSGGQNAKRKKEDLFNPILLHKFKEEEKALQYQLNKQFDKNTFEKILQLKTIRKSIEQKKGGKIVISGSLKDNISYKQSKEQVGQFLVIGIIILFAMVGSVSLIEALMYGFLSVAISYNLLVCFGAIVVLYFVNKTYFGNR
ncbi:hypothetical protein ES705_03141 [subsurface metagenome]